MARLKQKGDLAELAVATDLVRQGYRVAFPFGEDCDFDLIVVHGDRIERVQVKHARPTIHGALPVKCTSHSLTNGRVRSTKKYSAKTVDWIAVYNADSERCYYVPASELGAGRSLLHLRLTPARNNQRVGIRDAERYARLALPEISALP